MDTAAGTMSDTVFFLLFLSLIVIGCAAVIAINRMPDEPERKDPPRPEPDTIYAPPRQDPGGSGQRPPAVRMNPNPPEVRKPAPKPAQGSLDAAYAQQNNLWICPRCETINAYAAQSCAACGARRAE